LRSAQAGRFLRKTMESNTLIVHHRCGGKSLGYPPNTVLTAQWAMKNGARAIEYDVAIAKDGDKLKTFVIEPRLLREAGLDINNLFWSDVEGINVGNEKFGAQNAPLLESMLSTIDSLRVAHQIQIKGQHPASAREVLARVRKVKNCIITAFDINVIGEIKALDEIVRVGWLVKPAQEDGDEAGVDLTAKLNSEADELQEYFDDEITDIISKARKNAVDVVLLCGPRIKRRSLVRRVKTSRI
jgi:glycerophosphoryl diester phosphodiesterase